MQQTYKFRRFALIVTWLVSFWPLGYAVPVGAVANFNYDTVVSYVVNEQGQTVVTEDYTITNNTPRQYLTEIKLTTPVTALTALKVAYADGGVIPATTSTKAAARKDFNYNYQEIDVNFPRQIYGAGRVWEFRVSYVADGLVEGHGGSHTVYVPSIEPGDAGDDYKVSVDVPADFGTAHFPGAKSASGSIESGRQIYNFDKSELVNHSLALVFGNQTIYKTNFHYPLVNDSNFTRTLTVTLPPDLNNQHSFIKSLSPAPTNIRLDADGNVLADYKLKAHQKITVDTDIEVQVNYLEYDLSKSQTKDHIPKNLINQYIKPGRYWQTAGPVADQAAKLVDQSAPVINNVKALYQFVIDKLSYNKDKINFNIRQGAEKALANPSNAVCLEYADLLIAMLRSQGIPARMPIGYAYSGNLKATASVSDSLHAWVEAYVPGVGWITLDPTWGEKFDNFGNSDADHLAFAVWGENDELPAAIDIGAQDTGYQYEATSLSYVASAPKIDPAAQVQLTRFALLPFISLDQVTVTASAGVPTDNNHVQYDGRDFDLGSLAPGQKVTLRDFHWGGHWNQHSSVRFGRYDGSSIIVLATNAAHLHYEALWASLGALLVALLIGVVLRLRSRKKRSAQVASPPKANPTAP